MKKFFISSRNIISLVAIALIASVSSCDKTGPDGEGNLPIDEETPDAVLTLVDSLVEVSYEGGVFSVAYTLENPVEGVSVNAVSEQDFVGNFDYSTDGVISFTVAENEGETDRISTVEVSYGALKDYFSVSQSVTQYAISYEDLGNTVTRMYITPVGADPEQWYWRNTLSIQNIADNNIDTTQLKDGIMAWQKYIIDGTVESWESRGLTHEEAVAQVMTSAQKGASNWDLMALKGGIRNVGFVIPIDVETGELYGEPTLEWFIPSMPDMLNITFDMTVTDRTSTTITVDVKADNPDENVFWTFIDPLSSWEGMTEDEIKDKLASPYMGWKNRQTMTGSGRVVTFSNLEPSTDYVVMSYMLGGGYVITPLGYLETSTTAE